MKKIAFILAFSLFAVIVAQAQLITVAVKAGAVGVDSVTGNTDTYFYLNGNTGTQNSVAGANRAKATNPITQYEIQAVHAGKAHSAVSGSGDSTRITIEVSLDNTNWYQWKIDANQYIGNGMKDLSSNYFGTLTSGYALWTPTAGTGIWPYLRVKFDNDATGAAYPIVNVILKKL